MKNKFFILFDENLSWHEGPFDPYGWMIEEVLGRNGKR